MAGCPVPRSADAKGNPRDEVAAEAVLQAVEDFLATIADDLIEPGAAVHRDKQGALVQAGRLGVRGDGRVNQIVPYARDLGLGSAAVEPEIGQHTRHDIADGFGARDLSLLQRREIKAAPLRQDALARTRPRRAEGRDASGWEVQASGSCFCGTRSSSTRIPCGGRS